MDTSGVAETRPTKLGAFFGILVPEASARYGTDLLIAVDADHFSICQHESRTSSSYLFLIYFVREALLKLVENSEFGDPSFQDASSGSAKHAKREPQSDKFSSRKRGPRSPCELQGRATGISEARRLEDYQQCQLTMALNDVRQSLVIQIYEVHLCRIM